MVITIKTLLVMKLTAVLLIAACLQVSAKGNAQNISISQRNTSLEKVFKEIHRKTGYQFFYQDELLRQAKKFDINVKNASIEQVLELCFKDQPLNFTITEKTITIKRKEEVNVSNAPPPPPVLIEVTGKVKDENGKPLAGVSVSIVGGKGGVSTDEGGNFSISVPENAVLSFSYVGYKTVTVPVKGKTSIEITLNPDVSSMNDVVVIGYGTARSRQLVGAASVVSAKDAGSTIATNPAQLLIGKAAGVQVLNSSGIPGSGSQIIIRGTGSFTSVDPLYVIDGIQANGNIFNSLSSQDIESITILKDASSTAIYGAAAAANGVVIITTKKLRSGTPRISVTSQFGTSKAWRQLDLLKAKDYVDLIKDYAVTKGVALPPKLTTPEASKDVTDWQKEIFRNALSSENDVNVSGGSEKILYNLSLGYITQQATMKDFLYRKINTRFALDETLGRFHFGQSLNLRYSQSKGQVLNLFFDGVTTYPPYQPIYDPTVPGGYSIVSNARDLASARNPLQSLAMLSSSGDEYLLNPQLFGEVNIIKGLSLRSQISVTYGGGSSNTFQKAYTGSNDISHPRQVSLELNNYFTYTFENYLSYNRTFGKHNISATAGTSYIDEGYANDVTEFGSNIANDNIQNVNVALVKTVTSNVGYGTQVGRTKSYFGRIIYSFNDRYVLSGSIRRDGSSNFGPNNRYGNFPGAGFAWNFTEEDFIKRSLPFISNGKLRVGWGRTGNNRFPLGKTDVYAYSGTPGGTLIYSFGADEHFVPGTTVSTISNPDLRWEETDQTDAGIDLGFLNNRVTLTVDWYNRKSSGLLVNVPLPSTSGILGVARLGNPSIITNAADAQNKGIEVSLGYRSDSKRKF